jgi:PAS domain S-box-containing protein
MRHDETTPQEIKQSTSQSGGRLPAVDHSALKDRALDAAAEGITIADARLPDQPIIYVNEGFERLTGLPAEEVLGRNCRFLQGEKTDSATVAEIRRAVNEGRECVVELLNYHASGRPFWNRLSITPLMDDRGTVTHFIGVQSDITARKNAEERLREANTQLEQANRRISEDLKMASRIQRGFLPREKLCIDGLEIAWDLRPCDELAGDTLNVAPLDEGHVEFYGIDVSGHGVAAALLAVTLNHLLSPAGGRLVFTGRSPQTTGDFDIMSPAEIAKTLNQQFPYDGERNQYFTLIYGLYNKESRLFEFVSAGHPPPIYVPRSGDTQLDWIIGLPIGILEDFDYKQNTIQMAPGDRVYLFSDGLIEAFNESGEPFGLDRLRIILEGLRGKPLEETVPAVFDVVVKWGNNAPFEDDVSIVAFEAR